MSDSETSRARAIAGVQAIFDRYVNCIAPMFLYQVMVLWLEDERPSSLNFHNLSLSFPSVSLPPPPSFRYRSPLTLYLTSALISISHPLLAELTRTSSYKAISSSQKNASHFDKHVMDNLKIVDASPGTVLSNPSRMVY
jgi:hypothetical protein